MNENLFKALELENFSALFVSAEESFYGHSKCSIKPLLIDADRRSAVTHSMQEVFSKK